MNKQIKSLIEKYQNMSSAVKASLWFMAMNIIQKGIQFVVTPIYTRFLTSEQFGYYSIFTTWQGVFTIVATLNLSAGCFNNGMLKYEKRREEFISSIQGLSNTVAIIVFLPIFFFRNQVTNLMGIDQFTIICIFISCLLYPSFEYWSQKKRYFFEYQPLVRATLSYALINAVFSVAFIFLIPERKYAIILGTTAAQLLFGLFFYIHNLYKGKKCFNSTFWKFAFFFNVALVPHYLSFIILGQSDRIMINQYCGQSAVGIYSLSYTVSLLLNIIVNAVSSTLAPWTFQRLQSGNIKVVKKSANTIVLILGVVVVVGILLAPEMILFLGTREYLRAIWIIPPVMLSCFYTMIYSMYANIEFYFEKKLYITIASVAAAIGNIILNAIFIPMFGFIAAGYTTLFCYVALSIFHLCFMNQILKENAREQVYDIRFISLFSLFLSITCIFLSLLYEHRYLRYSVLLVVLLISILSFRKILALKNEFMDRR